MRPMLATAGPTGVAGARSVPDGTDWVHEVKWDGVRLLAETTPEGVSLTTRNGNVATAAWPDLVDVAPRRDLVLDGEVIALNERGRPDFRTLAERMHVRSAQTARRLAARVPATYMVFDLLRLDGRDLTHRPLAERRQLLEGLDLGPWQVPATYDDGRMLFDATRDQGLEGIVSKRLDSPYRPGERSRWWLKFAHRFRGSYVVGGWRPQTGTADRLAAVLVGEVTPDGLAYRGRVGSGLTGRTAVQLAQQLTPREASPFVDPVPAEDARGTFWVEPEVVVDVDTHGVGYQRLRQPSFQGVRADLSPEDL
ncbi:MAG TPA: non-homologous end-joining DNA ligase [Nocardioides sp.]|uniref:non-homologous end-joining DNA ligase n=1 Tax=Nocardioides sp. TaxID=35761 RepID=UPI002ED7B4A3